MTLVIMISEKMFYFYRHYFGSTTIWVMKNDKQTMPKVTGSGYLDQSNLFVARFTIQDRQTYKS